MSRSPADAPAPACCMAVASAAVGRACMEMPSKMKMVCPALGCIVCRVYGSVVMPMQRHSCTLLCWCRQPDHTQGLPLLHRASNSHKTQRTPHILAVDHILQYTPGPRCLYVPQRRYNSLNFITAAAAAYNSSRNHGVYLTK